MNETTKGYLKEVGKNSLFSLLIFAAVITFLFLVNLGHDIAPISIISGFLGVSYVLTVKNPSNYYGFVLGILSSIALGIQFYQSQLWDWTVLYFAAFIPCQIYTIYVWVKGSKNAQKGQEFNPTWLSPKSLALIIASIILLMCIDMFAMNYINNGSMFAGFSIISILSSISVATSIWANILLIRKKTDAWILWVVFSVSSVIMQLLLHNYITLTLFVVYTCINTSASIAWIKLTPKNNSK